MRAALPRREILPTPRRLGLEMLPRVALLADVAVMLMVGAVALVLRTSFDWFRQDLEVRDSFWIAGALMTTAWIASIAALGGYRRRLFGAGTEEYRVLLHATVLTAGLTGVVNYLTNFDLSRSLYVLIFTLGSLGLVVARAVLRKAIKRARRAGRAGHHVVIAGTPDHVDDIARVLSRESWLGYRVVGAVVPASSPSARFGETTSGTPILGTTDALLDVLDATTADVVFVAGGALDRGDQMRELVWSLEHRPVQVVVAPSVTDVSRERVRISPVGGLPLVHIDPPRHVLARRHAKRLFDVAVAVAILIAVAPAFAAIALAVRLHDGGPVFFSQRRTGRDGTEFSCLKFRTMVVDAEARLAGLQEAQAFAGGLFKMRNDPRITNPGRWLRRFSLDELPQLINVVRGEMSLVGPRPPLPSEVATYDRFTRRRLHVRPGLTGLWQISGRSDLSWEEAIRLDLYYVDNWSMVQDLSILLKTAGAVVSSRGAY